MSEELKSAKIDTKNEADVLAYSFAIALRRSVSRGDITLENGQKIIDEGHEAAMLMSTKTEGDVINFNLDEGPMIKEEADDATR